MPDEYVDDVVSTSWSLANTNRDPTIVVRARPGQLATQCPSCRARLLVDVIGDPSEDTSDAGREWLALPAADAMRHVAQVAVDAPLSAAATLLGMSPRRLVAVVDHAHHPLGVVTSTQLVAAVKNRARDELSGLTALDVATSSGPLLPARTPLRTCAQLLTREDRDFLLVVDTAGTLLGVLLSTDVLSAW